jgi:hypothetical protein
MGMNMHSTLMSDIMQEMNPRVLEFVQNHITSFTRWDMIRFLGENPNTRDTAENLARYVGRAPHIIVTEAKEMARENILRSDTRGDHTVYGLTDSPEVRQVIDALVKAARNRTFRMKLVYHILRAGGPQ